MFWRKENPNKEKVVFVGLSGGVDSAVSAALLQKEGYEVIGAFITIMLDGYPCSAREDRLDAQRVAAHLRIPFKEIDLSAAYKERIFGLSMREFAAGRTPNPDALCNREIKFGLFFDWAMAEGADFVATGHYARTRDGLLYMGKDADKDQSYFLWAVPSERLKKTLFPLGNLKKPQVRRLAKRMGLPNFDRPDSQGLCFLGDVSIEDMLEREIELIPGDVLNEAGEVVGRHDGAQAYTLGQRHGFLLEASMPNTAPHYVIGKDAEFNTITVSTNKFPKDSKATKVALSDVNWIGEPASRKLMARFRYRQTLIPATLDAEMGIALLHEPHYVPLGQSLVLYDGERCLGGGIIAGATLLPSWQSSSTNPTARAKRSTNASS